MTGGAREAPCPGDRALPDANDGVIAPARALVEERHSPLTMFPL